MLNGRKTIGIILATISSSWYIRYQKPLLSTATICLLSLPLPSTAAIQKMQQVNITFSI